MGSPPTQHELCAGLTLPSAGGGRMAAGPYVGPSGTVPPRTLPNKQRQPPASLLGRPRLAALRGCETSTKQTPSPRVAFLPCRLKVSRQLARKLVRTSTRTHAGLTASALGCASGKKSSFVRGQVACSCCKGRLKQDKKPLPRAHALPTAHTCLRERY